MQLLISKANIKNTKIHSQEETLNIWNLKDSMIHFEM